jgi:hypothetical protein
MMAEYQINMDDYFLGWRLSKPWNFDIAALDNMHHHTYDNQSGSGSA